MEKKLTNSGPLREPADKHSIYPCLLWFAGSALMGVLYDVSLLALIACSVVAQLIAVPVLFLVGHRREVA